MNGRKRSPKKPTADEMEKLGDQILEEVERAVFEKRVIAARLKVGVEPPTFGRARSKP